MTGGAITTLHRSYGARNTPKNRVCSSTHIKEEADQSELVSMFWSAPTNEDIGDCVCVYSRMQKFGHP